MSALCEFNNKQIWQREKWHGLIWKMLLRAQLWAHFTNQWSWKCFCWNKLKSPVRVGKAFLTPVSCQRQHPHRELGSSWTCSRVILTGFAFILYIVMVLALIIFFTTEAVFPSAAQKTNLLREWPINHLNPKSLASVNYATNNLNASYS